MSGFYRCIYGNSYNNSTIVNCGRKRQVASDLLAQERKPVSSLPLCYRQYSCLLHNVELMATVRLWLPRFFFLTPNEDEVEMMAEMRGTNSWYKSRTAVNAWSLRSVYVWLTAGRCLYTVYSVASATWCDSLGRELIRDAAPVDRRERCPVAGRQRSAVGLADVRWCWMCSASVSATFIVVSLPALVADRTFLNNPLPTFTLPR